MTSDLSIPDSIDANESLREVAQPIAKSKKEYLKKRPISKGTWSVIDKQHDVGTD
jgi:hypothetical protein